MTWLTYLCHLSNLNRILIVAVKHTINAFEDTNSAIEDKMSVNVYRKSSNLCVYSVSKLLNNSQKSV